MPDTVDQHASLNPIAGVVHEELLGSFKLGQNQKRFEFWVGGALSGANQVGLFSGFVGTRSGEADSCSFILSDFILVRRWKK